MALTCPECGSDKIVPAVPVTDYYGEMGEQSCEAEVKVQGNPRAWVFTDSAVGKLSADICGECGHATLRVSNFRELYEKYQQAGDR
jgi:hypothetical protein